MDSWTGILYFQVPLLTLAAAVVVSFLWWHHEGALRRLAGGTLTPSVKAACVPMFVLAWLALTCLSWWCVLDWAYVTVLATYSAFGAVGGWIAFIGEGVLLVSVPFLWGGVLFRLARREFREEEDALLAVRRAAGSARPPLRTLPG